MAKHHITFPIAEGVGIFVGIAAWDLLTDGRMDLAKAVLIALPCAIVWFGVRCWKERNKDKPHANHRLNRS